MKTLKIFSVTSLSMAAALQSLVIMSLGGMMMRIVSRTVVANLINQSITNGTRQADSLGKTPDTVWQTVLLHFCWGPHVSVTE